MSQEPELHLITNEQMDKLGIPVVKSEDGRVWPLPIGEADVPSQ